MIDLVSVVHHEHEDEACSDTSTRGSHYLAATICQCGSRRPYTPTDDAIERASASVLRLLLCQRPSVLSGHRQGYLQAAMAKRTRFHLAVCA